MKRHVLPGSARSPIPGARAVSKADASQRLQVSVVLRRGDATAARSDDIAAVERFAAENKLKVVESNAARRTVVLSGTVAALSNAFGVELRRFEYEGGSYCGHTGEITLPDELHGTVTAVLGLDDRPQARPHFRIRPSVSPSAVSYTPLQIASIYDFPAEIGSGQCIGILELGGGYRSADLETYFSSLNIPMPTVTAVSVDGASNAPTGDPNGPDGEVMLDIEIAGAIAPGAKIAVYFAPNTDAGFFDAVTTAIHDATNKPSVLSISWGGPESSWTVQAMNAMSTAFEDGATVGVSVCVAAGDGGSTDGVSGSANHVDFPASSPYVLGCGGTSLKTSDATTASEVVWNNGASGGATGGGVSVVFPLPAWQQGLEVTTASGAQTALAARGVPDVCGDADPETGYVVRVDGQNAIFGGTSAVAPLWAGLIARLNAGRSKPIGFINPMLYEAPGSLNDITQGDNGGYKSHKGWDACTGLGSPNGTRIAQVISGHAARSSRY